MNWKRKIIIVALMLILFGTNQLPGQEAEQGIDEIPEIDQIEMIMFRIPELPTPPYQFEVPSDPIDLWLKAIARPDPPLQRLTIDTIAIANGHKMKGLDVFIPHLVDLLRQEQTDREVRLAAIRTLSVLEATSEAELLADLARQHGSRVASLVEPILARWHSPAMKDAWLRRLSIATAESSNARSNATTTSPAAPKAGRVEILNAIRGVGAIGAKEATESLTTILNGKIWPAQHRLASAAALGNIHDSGLIEHADRLAATGELLPQLLAVKLLKSHSDAPTIDVLKRLRESEETTVQAGALTRLFEIDPELVEPFSDEAISSRDVNVRRIGAESMIHKRTPERMAPLSTLLDDVNPGLRTDVANAMVYLANSAGLREAVIENATNVLSQNSWRGCEQATMVLVNLDHKPCGTRLVELLNHDRDEVKVATAWGLGRLAVEKHLPAMLEQANAIHSGFLAADTHWRTLGYEGQIAHLFQTFGLMRYQPADEVLRAYLPKNLGLGENSRPAAAWAIGFLYEGNAPEDLVKLLVTRLNDINSDPPEIGNYRYGAAISLGRMKAESAYEELAKYANPNGGPVGMACLWGMSQITGEPIPEPSPQKQTLDDWFLTPLSK